MTDLHPLHPIPAQIAMLSDIFFARVDPLFKVLHRPTVRSFMLAAAENLDYITTGEGQEALMFAIYFAAVTSLSQEECLKLFHQDRERISTYYKYGVEAALANADFLNSMDIVPLQAFVIFLVSVSPAFVTVGFIPFILHYLYLRMNDCLVRSRTLTNRYL